MGRIASVCAAFAAAAVSVAASSAAVADSLEVSPTTLTLDTRRAGVLNVVNRSRQAIVAQVEAFDWSQGDGQDRLDPSRALQVSPPMIHLAPGQKQIVRVRAAPAGTAGSEQAFRLIVSELPDPAGTRSDGVRMLLQFKVPVFVGGAKGTPRQLRWSANPDGNSLILHVSNDGVRHAKLARLHVVTSAGQDLTIEPEQFYYVLPGAARAWTIPDAGVAAGAKLNIEGIDEGNGAKIDDAIVAGR